MRILRQFDSLLIDDFEESVYSYPDHSHTYFELVFIRSGKGMHHLNGNIVPYCDGNLFILTPGDHHFFDISISTHFTFIKFTESYYHNHRYLVEEASNYFAPSSINQLKLFKETRVELQDPFKEILKNTVENIVLYCEKMPDASFSPVIFFQLLSILNLLKTFALRIPERKSGAHPSSEAVSTYVHENILSRSKLSISSIANQFSISPGYFSKYFKRTFGISYKDYIGEYRLKLIQERLLSGNCTLREIADEFDFFDESHLIKSFNKKLGVNPKEFRNKALMNTIIK
ncbi:helix-turn-helix domain-containing protein [Desertivirga arenae]|uniref:helix-turn-helix domain-containing protein n=1 Tax=Desertivirga arenae TaxID=2810309 RepID=UPI001A979E75|nr:AraC family transcriptional regulator [Pedobacter sp. SYSU D00823]